MQFVPGISSAQTMPAAPAPSAAGRKPSLWILDSWRDLALYVCTPLLLVPMFIAAQGVWATYDSTMTAVRPRSCRASASLMSYSGASPRPARSSRSRSGRRPGCRRSAPVSGTARPAAGPARSCRRREAPHPAERDTADQVLDVDTAIAQGRALLVGLGDLRLERDHALEAVMDLNHVDSHVVANGRLVGPRLAPLWTSARPAIRGRGARRTRCRRRPGRTRCGRACRPGLPCQNSMRCGRTRYPPQCDGRGMARCRRSGRTAVA